MKLRALSHYDGDTDTRFGDCILLYDVLALIVYDCGHVRHSEAVESFLSEKTSITQVHVVVSHNDSDHTNGVIRLLDWFAAHSKYTVKVYTHQYLKHVDTILSKIKDARRNRESLKESLLAEFDNIARIIEAAQKHRFPVFEALPGTNIGGCTIVGPMIDKFTDVAARAIDSRLSNSIGEGHAEETVMNAASVQLECILDNADTVLLCGDASPDYLFNLDNYNVIQLPHHGQLSDAKAIFQKLKDAYRKDYFVSDNTGSGTTSGGSADLVQYMKDECYAPAKNTKTGTLDIPALGLLGSIVIPAKLKGVKLGDMDFRLWE